MTDEVEDIKSEILDFLANELEDGVLNDDGSISFKWDGKVYTGFFSIVNAEDPCERIVEIVSEPKKYNGGLNPSPITR